MGESNVFTIQLNKFFGIGISYETWMTDGINVPVINLSLPFTLFSVYFRKSHNNGWFTFYNGLTR